MIETIQHFFIIILIILSSVYEAAFPTTRDVPLPEIASFPPLAIRYVGDQVTLHSYGSASGSSHLLWSNWGPATRANIYRTEENWLVVLGGGGSDEMFHLSTEGRVVPVPRREWTRTDDRRWTYIGAADLYLKKEPRFYTPAELPECFAMFGAGSSPYRLEHQVMGSCRR